MGDCKRHPGVAAVMGKNDRSTGLCRECLGSRARKANRDRFGNQSGKRPRRALPARSPLTPALSPEGRGGKGRSISVEGRGRKNVMPEVIAQAPAVVENGGEILIPAQAMLGVTRELRVELVYRLAEAKIVKERV